MKKITVALRREVIAVQYIEVTSQQAFQRTITYAANIACMCGIVQKNDNEVRYIKS